MEIKDYLKILRKRGWIIIVVALLAGSSLRAHVDLGLVVSAACLLGVLSVLERRQVAEIVRKLEEVYQTTKEIPVSSGKPNGGREEKVVYIQAFLKRPGDEEQEEE